MRSCKTWIWPEKQSKKPRFRVSWKTGFHHIIKKSFNFEYRLRIEDTPKIPQEWLKLCQEFSNSAQSFTRPKRASCTARYDCVQYLLILSRSYRGSSSGVHSRVTISLEYIKIVCSRYCDDSVPGMPGGVQNFAVEIQAVDTHFVLLLFSSLTNLKKYPRLCYSTGTLLHSFTPMNQTLCTCLHTTTQSSFFRFW